MFSFISFIPFISLFLLGVFAQNSTNEYANSGGWHFDAVYTLGNEQLDPIVNPNGQATHMHKIIGGNSFRAAYNYELTQTSSCSSVSVQADKSNYWMPSQSPYR